MSGFVHARLGRDSVLIEAANTVFDCFERPPGFRQLSFNCDARFE
jgi:hypothetical protein